MNTRLPTALTLLGLFAATAGCQKPQRDLDPVEGFVTSTFFHGVPYALANRYGPRDVPKLTTMLRDPQHRAHWANIAWVLGIVGDENAEKALMSFLEHQHEGELDSQTLQALMAAHQALGFRAHKPSTAAFRYLAEGTTPTAWQRRGLKWTFPGWPEGDRELLMAKLSVNALGLAGNPEACGHLEDLGKRLPKTNPALWTYLGPNVTEGSELCRKIERLGYEAALASNRQTETK